MCNKIILTLEMFTKKEYDFLGECRVKYLLNINNYKIHIYQLFGKLPFNISFTYPSGYSGDACGFLTPQEAVDYLNEKEWWNFIEPMEWAFNHLDDIIKGE